MRLKTSLIIGLLCLSLPGFSLAESADIEHRLQQQERRIDRLEKAVEALQEHLMDQQYGQTGGTSDRSTPRSAVDPMVGVWHCTNNVFDYEISFFPDGRLVQEEPFFGKAREGRWTSVSSDHLIIDREFSYYTDFRSEGVVTVTDQATQSEWECTRQ